MALINEKPFRGLAGANMCEILKRLKRQRGEREISKANGSGKRKERSLQMSHVEGGLNR